LKSKASRGVDVPENPFPVVGIGASAGGLQALEDFLSALPDEFHFSIVFVQHLSPKHESLLPDLLRSRKPNLDITEIADNMELLPGQVYLCPPAREVRLEKGVFRITARPEAHTHLPVDEFLLSLAEDISERSIAVIFSGAGTDGARGVQAVRNAGGTVYVQDPASAEFPSMPLAAINTGHTDGVLSPENIAREIIRFHGFGMTAAAPEGFIDAEQFEPFFRLIYEKTGYRFQHYKKTVVSRRIRRRMYLHGISKIEDYLEFLGMKDLEADNLASDLMIGVTSFFRDRLAWKDLHIEVTRKLAAREDDSPIRIWTPACATGEEAYSIAMLLQDELDLRGRKRELQIFATDVNDKALEQAREGTYQAALTADLPPDYLKRFFTLSEDGLSATINKEIRQYVVFAKHDLLSDPPFSRLDLVICRNLLIYLDPVAQEKCIALFHYALREEGFLFLGNAESPGRRNTFFNSVGHKKCRLYRKAETKVSSRMPLAPPFATERNSATPPRPEPPNVRPPAIQSIQEALLEEYAPAAVAIDRNHDILYHNGPTNRYLRQPRGTPTQNVFDLLPESLRNRVRGGLFRAAKETKPVSIRATILDESERKRQLVVRISKLQDGQFLIVFREKSGLPEEVEAIHLESAAVEETAVRQLESELSATREALQSHIEQLKSLNEELQSSNEELQAANEELETSREELQSLNEELITVNAQLQIKIEEQEGLNNDLGNFLTSTSIPTIFLDHRFRVKRFTPAMTKLIKLIPSDLGRPIIDMSQENLGPDLIADAQSVLESLVPVRKDLQINNAWYVRAVLPYRTSDNRIEGVVITYTDITERTQAEETLRQSESRYRDLVQNANSAIVRWRHDGTITFFNEYAQTFFGYSADEVIGRKATILVPERDSAGADLTTLVEDIVSHPENYVNNVNENICKDGRRVWMAWTNKPIFGENGRVAEILAVGSDITERRRAEDALKESEQRVRRKLDSILSPEGDIGTLELSDIIDVQTIRSLIADFSALAHITVAILDLKGNVLVGEGWQEVCTKFHRAHPDACRHCIESDTQLTEGVLPGESRLYKCKNNMWDIATPVMVGGQHVGNIFSGQFFFDNEPLDYELFRRQAAQYGFDEKEYIAALEAVPRLSRDSVDRGIAFLMKLAGTLSRLSYSNIKLARSLAEEERLLEEAKVAEQAVRQLGQFPEQNPSPVLRVGLDGTLLYENTPARDMLNAMVSPENGVLPQHILLLVTEASQEKSAVESEKTDGLGRTFWFNAVQPAGEEYVNIYARNVTERKHAEEALRGSEERFRSMFEHHKAVMLLIEADTGLIVDANAAAVEYYGYTREQLSAIHIQEINQLTPANVAAERQKATQEQRNHFVFQHRLADGSLRWVDVYSTPFESRGKVLLFSIIHDITERKQVEDAKLEAERTLTQNLERLDIISSTASQLLLSKEPQLVVESLCRRVMEHLDCHAFFNFLVDDERNCLRLNAYAGIPEETAQAIRFLDFGVAVCGCAARDACRIVAENIPTTPDIRTELVRSFGINAYACHPLMAQGRVIGTLSFGTCSRLTFTEDELSMMKTVADQVATAMERTRLLRASEERSEELERRVEERTAELKQREEMLRLAGEYSRSLLEASIDPLVTIDREGRISDVNTATEGVTGYSRQTLIGTDFADYFTDPEKARTVYQRVFREGLVRDYELEIRHREGRVTPVLYNASVYRDKTGNVAGVFAAARDIAEQRRLEDHLRQTHKMEAIGTLAGGIAHDFNNILASILGFTEIAIEDLPDRPLVVKTLQNVHKSTIRARDLVKQILAFSRKSENTRSPIQLKLIVKETIHLLRASIPTTIEIKQSISAASDMVLAAPVEIQQILMNLSTNAAFAMREGGGRLNIGLSNVTIDPEAPSVNHELSPGEYVLLEVQDTGIGMKPEVIKRIFEPFFTTKGVGQGTGMGLAVVYGLAKSLGGAVIVESEPAKGSTFQVYLPTMKLEKQVVHSRPDRSLRGHERILFVDDEEMLANLGSERLKSLGYDVVATTDAREALRIFKAEPDRFDLIVTDYTMPHLTGMDLAGKLLKVRADVPIILCTGYSEAISSEKAKEAGVREFLMKPLTKQEMAEVIRRVLDGLRR
jgi:two-component system, chemotaxis family, CheB/CheR fusion protein